MNLNSILLDENEKLLVDENTEIKITEDESENAFHPNSLAYFDPKTKEEELSNIDQKFILAKEEFNNINKIINYKNILTKRKLISRYDGKELNKIKKIISNENYLTEQASGIMYEKSMNEIDGALDNSIMSILGHISEAKKSIEETFSPAFKKFKEQNILKLTELNTNLNKAFNKVTKDTVFNNRTNQFDGYSLNRLFSFVPYHFELEEHKTLSHEISLMLKDISCFIYNNKNILDFLVSFSKCKETVIFKTNRENVSISLNLVSNEITINEQSTSRENAYSQYSFIEILMNLLDNKNREILLSIMDYCYNAFGEINAIDSSSINISNSQMNLKDKIEGLYANSSTCNKLYMIIVFFTEVISFYYSLLEYFNKLFLTIIDVENK